MERLMTRSVAAETLMARGLAYRGEWCLRGESVREDDLSVEAVLSTDTPSVVYDWNEGEYIEEILVPSGMRGLGEIPMLESHDRWSTEAVLGRVGSIRVENGAVVGRLYFVPGVVRSEEAWKKVKAGAVTRVSVGYRVESYSVVAVGQSLTVDGRTYTATARELRVTTSWELRECSLVVFGADELAVIRRGLAGTAGGGSGNGPAQGAAAEKKEATAMPNWAKRKAGILRGPDDGGGAGGAGTGGGQRSDAQDDAEKEDEEEGSGSRSAPAVSVKAERKRQEAIRRLATESTPAEMLERALNSDMSPEAFATQLLRHERAALREPVSTSAGGGGRGDDAAARRQQVMALSFGQQARGRVDLDAQYRRARERGDQATLRALDEAESLRELSLLDVVREVARINGLQGRSAGEVLEQVFGRSASAGDLQYIFTTNINTSLLLGYGYAPDTTRGWTDTVALTDYKTAEMIQIDFNDLGKEVPVGGEANEVTYVDRGANMRLRRFGMKVVFDEIMIKNDRFDLLSTVPVKMGQRMARYRPDLVYALLNAGAMFSTDNGNLAGSAALSLDTLAAARAAMMKQTKGTGDSKEVLDIVPGTLIVPPTLGARAASYLNSTEVRNTSGKDVTYNIVRDWGLSLVEDGRLEMGSYNPLTEARVDGSASHWYLAARKETAQGIVVGELAGQAGPQMRSYVLSEGRWGIGGDVQFAISATCVDPKALYKSQAASL